LRRGQGRRKRDVGDAGKTDLIRHCDDDARRGMAICRDDNAAMRIGGLELLDVARTARKSIGFASIEISPCSSMTMLLIVFTAADSTVLGLPTSMPACFTKTAVMMKKMSRFTTKSSIGARSMPCDSAAKCPRDAVFMARLLLTATKLSNTYLLEAC
jgi:hypothetical protein